jgi:uncharacterized membrane protein YcaP (DUF421 family)
MRIQGIGDINEIEYGIFEQNGKISLLKSSESPLAHTVIIDGSVVSDDMTKLGFDSKWLNRTLGQYKASEEDIFLLTVNDNGKVTIIKKE